MARQIVDMSKSLEELESDFWGDPDYDSYLVRTSYALRRKPLRDLTIEDLRIAISQPPHRESLPYLVPIALKHLSADPLLEATYYEGDLLKAVLEVPTIYWAQHPEQRKDLEGIVPQFLAQAEHEDESWRTSYFPDIAQAIKGFLG